MSGSGMIAALPEGLAVDMAGQPEGCVSGWDSCPFLAVSEDEVQQALAVQARLYGLGIIMLAAAKCTDVSALADRGAIERDGADLFIR